MAGETSGLACCGAGKRQEKGKTAGSALCLAPLTQEKWSFWAKK
jgi:hypothetical protein